jgi:hypothetical protein
MDQPAAGVVGAEELVVYVRYARSRDGVTLWSVDYGNVSSRRRLSGIKVIKVPG